MRTLTDTVSEYVNASFPQLGFSANAININYYEDGQEFVDWHSDDEPIFFNGDSNSTIISLSLGETLPLSLAVKAMQQMIDALRSLSCNLHVTTDQVIHPKVNYYNFYIHIILIQNFFFSSEKSYPNAENVFGNGRCYVEAYAWCFSNASITFYW